MRPTELVRDDSEYRGGVIGGRYLRGTGLSSPVPPGITRLPGGCQLMVSPALAELIAADPGPRSSFRQKIVGTVGDAGPRGPADLSFHGGTGPLTPAAWIGPRAWTSTRSAAVPRGSRRIRHWWSWRSSAAGRCSCRC
ncbi:hypothetical protein AB0F91_10835 [Amycolatopsis sp. NPDC023774]|uniref:hypothetical protein n=1 Tax=Amycolatopsis sp. NPDC023774 TaxID=3155015 RepID=UPI0033DB10C8